MGDKFQYRLSRNQKVEIAQNLIDFLQKDSNLTEQARSFIGNWIVTPPEEKTKAFFDVWDIVLKNYLPTPTTRRILFRACNRLSKNGKIASFTGQLESARYLRKFRGSCVIICDTKETLQFEEQEYKPGEYKHTFYPLVSVLEKVKASGGCGLSKNTLDRWNNYIDEDEYIMRIDLDNMYGLRWIENDL